MVIAAGAFIYSRLTGRLCCVNQPLSNAQQNQTSQPATIDDNTDWKIYRDEKRGIELQYPRDWPNPKGTDKKGLMLGPVRLYNLSKSEVYDLVKYVYSRNDRSRYSYFEFIKDETINNLRIVIYKESDAYTTKHALIFDPESAIKLGVMTTASDLNREKAFDKIVSTFKFIK